MTKDKLLYTLIAIFVLVGGFFAFNAYIYHEKQADTESVASVRISGKVIFVDMTQAMVDGPVLVSLQPKNGDTVLLSLPSMGRNLCVAKDKIEEVRKGDSIEVVGYMNEDGSITPCMSPQHELRVIEKAPAATLTHTSWVWQYTELLSGDTTVAQSDSFVLTLNEKLSAASKTDCNQMSGSYSVNGEVLSFGPFAMTKMYCEGSMEGEYAKQLALTRSYSIEGDTLRLHLDRDYGTMIFVAK